ncbi:hypothetical protein [Actinokineospora iranica]|uniref:Beta-lactamase class A n=1 Tax=Actinokineospora iranica TaxID=1271860 RepID=A0A1G6X4K1_9PSEU|nr:hypothetical protein [Actinokineospora iranica]SDD72823.1 hypothetical protein SAMN05216174_11694 [Actinokineospora iranica]
MRSRPARLAATGAVAITVSFVLVASSAAAPPAASASSPAAPLARPAAPPPLAAVSVDPAAVAAAVTAAVRGVSKRADVGLIVWDRALAAPLVSVEADRRFRSASLVKLLIAIQAAPDPTRRARVERMLRDSNDDDASILWGLHGGDALPAAAAATLGRTGPTAPDIPGRWGNTPLTPDDVLAACQHLLTTLPTLVDPMRAAPRRAADGFDQHFGIPSAFPAPWAVKQSWGSAADHVAVHSTGTLGAGDRYIVVLMTNHPPGTPFRSATAAVTAGAQALASTLTLT